MGSMQGVLSGWIGWTSRTPAPPGMLGLESVNFSTNRGYPWPDRGFKILRQIDSVTADKAGSAFTHQHTDGTEYPWYYWNTKIYKETGSASTSIITGLTETFVPTVVRFSSPNGVSVVLNGTNSEAQQLYVTGAALTGSAFDLAAPGGTFTGADNVAGGSLSNGTYLVRITQIDDAGATVVESGPTSAVTVTVNEGGASQKITLDLTNTTFATRATKYRVYMSSSTDTPSAFLKVGSDTAKATTSFDITALGSTAITSRNSVYRTAVMPLTAARVACAHMGRLFIGSLASNLIYWSERDAPNHWYTTNGISETEGGWNAPCTGIGSAEDGVYVFTANSIHRIYGDFSRDAVTYAPRVGVELVDTGIGCVSHGSIVSIPGHGLFFMSQLGPCAIVGGRIMRLAPTEIRDYLNFLDWTYAARWVGCYDPYTQTYNLLVGRKANSSRAMDGQGVAGINDRVIRWNLDSNNYSPPLELFATHLSLRKVGTVGATSARDIFTSVGAHATAKQHHFGYADGVANGVVTSTDYDGKLASSSSTTSVTFARTAGTDQDLVGYGITLYYPSDDSNYPGVLVYREVKANTYSGGNVVISWTGALTVPSGTNWTVRLAGKRKALEIARQAAMSDNPQEYTRLDRIGIVLADVVGAEAKA